MDDKTIDRIIEILNGIAKSMRRQAVAQEAIAEEMLDQDTPDDDEDDPESPEDFD